MSTTNATPSRRPTPAREDATIWELGDHDPVAREVIAAFGPELVAACAIEPGARVLDVGAAARELVRVCRPGGRIGLINWTPEGTAAELFAVFARHAPPPAQAGPVPVQWHSAPYVRELLGGAVTNLEATSATPVKQFADPEALCDYYRRNFGPVIAAYAALAADRSARSDSTASSPTSRPAPIAEVADVLELRAADREQRAMLEDYLGDLTLLPSARVLEIGCGPGPTARAGAGEKKTEAEFLTPSGASGAPWSWRTRAYAAQPVKWLRSVRTIRRWWWLRRNARAVIVWWLPGRTVTRKRAVNGRSGSAAARG